MSNDYEVGYKKPPRQHQFGPGNQAASKRRKKPGKARGLSLPEIIDKALNTKRKAKRGDTIIEMPVAEILVERLVQAMTSGPVRDLKMIIDLIQQHAPNAFDAPMEEFAVRYHRAEGSTVPLPSLDLWKGEKS